MANSRIFAVLLIAYLVFASLLAAEAPESIDTLRSSQEYATQLNRQKFVCNIGYTVEKCLQQRAAVQKTVAHYHPDDLGNWTWILVRADDWRDLMQRLHMDSHSPAFTALELRTTFLEESLVAPRPERAKELMDSFSMPVDRLLDFAVSHEIGHAICHGGTESLAEGSARRLRQGIHAECGER